MRALQDGVASDNNSGADWRKYLKLEADDDDDDNNDDSDDENDDNNGNDDSNGNDDDDNNDYNDYDNDDNDDSDDDNDDNNDKEVADRAEASRGDVTGRWTVPSTVVVAEERRSADGTDTGRDEDTVCRHVDTVVPSSTRSLSSPSLSQRDSKAAVSGAVWATSPAIGDGTEQQEDLKKWSVLVRNSTRSNATCIVVM